MHGLSGSGKSTLAKQIAKSWEDKGYGVKILSTDNFFMVDDEYKWTADSISEAHQWNQSNCAYLMFRDYPVIIIDNTNLNSFSVKKYFELAKKYKYRLEFAQPTTDWANNVEECAKRNTHKVPLETLRKMQSSRETIESMLSKYKDLLYE